MKYRKTCGCGFETVVAKEVWTKCPECGDKTNWEFIPTEGAEKIVKVEGETVDMGVPKKGGAKLLTYDKNKKKFNIYILSEVKRVGYKLGEIKSADKALALMKKL